MRLKFLMFFCCLSVVTVRFVNKLHEKRRLLWQKQNFFTPKELMPTLQMFINLTVTDIHYYTKS